MTKKKKEENTCKYELIYYLNLSTIVSVARELGWDCTFDDEGALHISKTLIDPMDPFNKGFALKLYPLNDRYDRFDLINDNYYYDIFCEDDCRSILEIDGKDCLQDEILKKYGIWNFLPYYCSRFASVRIAFERLQFALFHASELIKVEKSVLDEVRAQIRKDEYEE